MKDGVLATKLFLFVAICDFAFILLDMTGVFPTAVVSATNSFIIKGNVPLIMLSAILNYFGI